MGNRVAVMKGGVLQQVDTPQFIYDNPANLFVAGFIGSPPMNLCEAGVSRDDAGTYAHLGDQRLRIGDDLVKSRPALGDYVQSGKKVVVGIRPEDMEDASISGPVPDQMLKTKVDIIEALGSEVMVHFGVDAKQVFSDGATRDDDDSLVRLGGETGATFVASFSARTAVQPGALVDVTVDTAHLHFFDPATGARV